MNPRVKNIKEQLFASAALKQRIANDFSDAIEDIVDFIVPSLQAEKKMLICGNGGSAADAQHFAAEMVGRLKRERPAIPAIALTTDTSILTAVGNDYDVSVIFERQIHALGAPDDVLVVLSTSGNSANIVTAVQAAKSKGLRTIGLLGKGGGKVATMVDKAIIIPDESSQRIQEMHITIIHIWCELIEDALYPTHEHAKDVNTH